MFSLISRIAWNSLARRRMRSIMVVVMIAVSLWGLLFIEGLYDGMTEQMINNAIRSDSGHISIFAKGYRLDPDLSCQIENSPRIVRLLEDDSRVDSYARKIEQNGLVATAHASRPVKLYGVDLHEMASQCQLQDYIYAQDGHGKYTFGTRDNGAFIGFKLADKLQARVGNKLVFSAQDSHGELVSTVLRVRAVVKTNNRTFDDRAVFVSSTKAANLLGLSGQVSQIAIMLKDEQQTLKVQHQLLAALPQLDIMRWDQLYPALLQSRQMMKVGNTIISLMIFCAVSLGIFGVMLVSVLERMREFGIMQAIGTPFPHIRNIIIVEALILGGSGFVAGAALGGATLLYFHLYGLDLSMFSSAFEQFGMDAVTFAIIRPGYFITASFAVLLAALLSVVVPVRILRRAQPVEIINKM